MARYTLDDTRPLLDEIKARMGEAWEPEPTEGQVDSVWRARGGRSYSANELLSGRVAAGDVLRMMGHEPTRDAVAAELRRDREARIAAARAGAEASLRRDLRSGSWTTFTRGRNGLSRVDPKLWDGMDADRWLRTGQRYGCELRVVREAGSVTESAGDRGEQRAIRWLKEKWPHRNPADKAKERCLKDAREAISGLGTEAFKRAWQSVSKAHPKWGMSQRGRRS